MEEEGKEGRRVERGSRRTRFLVLGRRDVLRWAGGAVGILAIPSSPGCSKSSSGAPPAPAYFSAADAEVLNALADAVLPPDDAPGGSAFGLVPYLDALLTAFDHDPPTIYAGGPYSGREALPGATGAPSSTFPADDFATFLPLDRYQEKAWRLRIYGSSGVPGGGPNDAVTGPVVGLREAVATALSAARSVMPAGVAASGLTLADKTTMFGAIDPTTRATLIELVLEASFSPPEYGGNPGEAGWKLCNFEGDAQPVGYSWFDPARGAYAEDPSHPVSTPTPGADPMPLSASTEATLSTVIALLGGMELGA